GRGTLARRANRVRGRANVSPPTAFAFPKLFPSMKKILTLLMLLLLPCAHLGAQGLHGKLLIVRDTVWHSANRLESILPNIYSGSVDSMSSLPQNISQFDAIMLFIDRPHGIPRDTISTEDNFRLIEYLKNGGRLYAEGGLFLND